MTCSDDKAGKVEKDAYKRAAFDLPVEIDLYEFCARKWAANEDYQATNTIVPREPNGFALEALNDGRTGEVEPAWPRELGATAWSGSVQFEVVEAAGNGISVATAPTYTVEPGSPAALDVLDIEITESRKLSLTYTGGVAGVDYEVLLGFTVDALPRGMVHTVHVI